MISRRAKRQDAVRGTCLLLRRALGNPLADEDYEHMRGIDARQLVRLTTAHSVANFVSRAFDDPSTADFFDKDLIGFFRHLRNQNRERNRRLQNQLIEASLHLQCAEIPAMALKGAAEFVAPIYGDPADRILSDLDVLVPANRIDDARNVLKKNGYTDYGFAYDRSMRHAPSLWHQDELTAIELHTAASCEEALPILPPKDLFDRAVSAKGIAPFAPSPVDRLCHLVSHAQIDSYRYSANMLLLRDTVDYAMMTKSFGQDCVSEAGERFENAGFIELFQSFTAVSEYVIADATSVIVHNEEANDWAKATTNLLAEPGHHRLAMLASIIAWLWERVSSGSAARRQFLSGLLSPMRIRHFLSRSFSAMRGLQ